MIRHGLPKSPPTMTVTAVAWAGRHRSSLIEWLR